MRKQVLFSALICGSLLLSGFVPLAADTPLGVSGSSTDDYQEIRDKIPYVLATKITANDHPVMQGINQDATAQQIAYTLSVLDIADKSFIDPKELPWDSVLRAAEQIAPTGLLNTLGQGSAFSHIQKELGVGTPVVYASLYLQEHMEKNIRRLFGEDYQITHHTAEGRYQYFSREGIYAVMPMEHAADPVVAVLDYNVSADMVIARVSYVHRQWDAFIAEDGKTIQEQGLEDYLRNRAPRALAVFGTNADGSLYIRSHYAL